MTTDGEVAIDWDGRRNAAAVLFDLATALANDDETPRHRAAAYSKAARVMLNRHATPTDLDGITIGPAVKHRLACILDPRLVVRVELASAAPGGQAP